jgi:hypothetical protein
MKTKGEKVKVKHPHFRPIGPKGFWEVKASRLHASALEGGRLSAIRTGRLYPQGKRKVIKLN